MQIISFLDCWNRPPEWFAEGTEHKAKGYCEVTVSGGDEDHDHEGQRREEVRHSRDFIGVLDTLRHLKVVLFFFIS
jgi:hypothetical protein